MAAMRNQSTSATSPPDVFRSTLDCSMTNQKTNKPIRVAICYRVMQDWRVPVFSRLSKRTGIELCVFHGEDFGNSKVVNFSGEIDFPAKQLRSLKLAFKTRNGPAYIPYNLGLWDALKTFGPDVIITEGASNALNNRTCFRFARRYNRKIVQWGLGRLRGRKPSFARRLLDHLFFRSIERNSDAAIAYSSTGAEYYRDLGFPDSSIYVAVNTVDTEARQAQARRYVKEAGLPFPSPVPDQFNILFVGAITYNKGVDLLLRVFVRLANESDTARLTLVGDGILRSEMETLAKECGIEERIQFVGHVAKDIAPYFCDASVMVMPGLGGLAVSDALCHGVPVICGIGDGSEVDLVTGENGQILDPLTEETLFKALKTLMESPSMQKSWRDAAPKIIAEKYNIDAYVREIERCVFEVAS